MALKKKEILLEKRVEILTLKKENFSIRRIADKLGIPKSTVLNTISRFKKYPIFNNLQRSGRPKVMTLSDDQQIILLSKRDRKKTAVEIKQEFNKGRLVPISRTTIRRRLKDAGLNGRVAVRKPLLRKQNKRKRLDWAKKYKDWTVDDWRRVLFTDESKFQLFGTKRRVYVRRSVKEKMMNECIVPTVKHGGGSILVWGCFASNQVGDFVRITGILNKEGYLDILSKNAIPSGFRLIGSNFIFQQDNDPKHSSKICKKYLSEKEEEKALQIMIWPPQSPDCNPIELLWDELDREVKKMTSTNVEQLFTNLTTCWKNIGPEKLEKLLVRMPKICKAVIKAKGGYFDENNI